MAGKEKRKEDRFNYEMPEFVYAEFITGKGATQEKVYNLKISDCSQYGLSMVITQKDFDLLEALNEGDELKEISFFATWTVLTVDGTVRHKTKIEEGKYEGCYLVGIESQELIENFKPLDP